MKIAILRDEILNNGSMDELDNKVEADFAESSLARNHTVRQLAFVPDLREVKRSLLEFAPDMVFNLVESVCGSGALSTVAVQLLDVMGIPYTGNHTFAQIVSADKNIAKHILQDKGIPTPKACFLHGAEYIMKVKTEHASMALDDTCIRTFNSEREMKDAIAQKKCKTGMEWIAERYIDGREFNCAFLGKEVLPPAEIRFDNEFLGHKILTYEAKWDDTALSYRQSLRSFCIEEDIAVRLKRITETCRCELNLKGYARVDFRMDKFGNLFVIDINTNPCISPDSGFVAMAGMAGISNEQMFEIIVQDAINS